MEAATRCGAAFCVGLAMVSSAAMAQHIEKASAILGAWTGNVSQNSGASHYTVNLTLTDAGGTSDYPELKCGRTLKRVGAANGYVFYTEVITRGGTTSGGSCIDGTVTVAPAGAGLSWGWMGTYGGRVYVGWSDLVRK